LAPMLDANPPAFPFVALLVSGGHTLLMDVLGVGLYRLLGESLDDAAGEAFDKTAKLLGLGYPGGPAIEALARQGHPGRYHFSRPLLERPTFDFSFSGLKTQALLAIQTARPLSPESQADLAYEFQAAALEVLVTKAARAVAACGRERLVAAGGVTANRQLRAALTEAGQVGGFEVFYPRPEFCTDNGAMIAYAGSCRMGTQRGTGGFEVRARWPLAELSPP
ncbi:MAG TPA: tRNA (adenosine(37)-N6)-threonylcarbamoyltransferase complex transferase subunit TsaD, partial [Acidiferrobacteraceae bacterium]|nr:tRNA (adenosine(37)-N6)-threonylcarbamoyltransferase complex transferase subunit TsaD [Acidiferrobacteraceae bacterium]